MAINENAFPFVSVERWNDQNTDIEKLRCVFR